MREEILGVRVKNGRGMVDRRIDEAVIGHRIAAAGDDRGLGPPGARSLVFGFVIHAFVLRVSGSNSLRCRSIWLFSAPFRHFRAFSAFVNPLTSYGDRSQMIADG